MVTGRSCEDSNLDRPERHPDGSGRRPDGSGRLLVGPLKDEKLIPQTLLVVTNYKLFFGNITYITVQLLLFQSTKSKSNSYSVHILIILHAKVTTTARKFKRRMCRVRVPMAVNSYKLLRPITICAETNQHAPSS